MQVNLCFDPGAENQGWLTCSPLAFICIISFWHTCIDRDYWDSHSESLNTSQICFSKERDVWGHGGCDPAFELDAYMIAFNYSFSSTVWSGPHGLRGIDKNPIIIIIDWENSLFRNRFHSWRQQRLHAAPVIAIPFILNHSKYSSVKCSQYMGGGGGTKCLQTSGSPTEHSSDWNGCVKSFLCLENTARSSRTNKHPYKSPPFIKYASVGEWCIGDPMHRAWMSADGLQWQEDKRMSLPRSTSALYLHRWIKHDTCMCRRPGKSEGALQR